MLVNPTTFSIAPSIGAVLSTKDFFPSARRTILSLFAHGAEKIPISITLCSVFIVAALKWVDHEQGSVKKVFLALFLFKFVKIVVHMVSFLAYKPAVSTSNPAFSSLDCTVIIPTIGNMDEEFKECVNSIRSCNPASIIISTVGSERLLMAKKVCREFKDHRISCVQSDIASKREQVMVASSLVSTKLTVLADDHVFWPKTFLQSATIPFQDKAVGLVGTAKRVRRNKSALFSINDILNYIACIYLERHNYECTSSSNIDGGLFVISGRTSIIRTDIIQSPELRKDFLNETWLFGKIGFLNVDDDNCLTRFMVRNGHKTVFHNHKDALVQTSLGTGDVKKFSGQLDRWARTTWRSNSTSLFADRTTWKSQPWTTYSVFLTSFVNLALFYDAALIYTLRRCTQEYLPNLTLLLVLIGSKMIKPLPHLCRNPRDWLYLPLGILFGYLHSLIRVKALLTCYNIEWGTRPALDTFTKIPQEIEVQAPKATVSPTTHITFEDVKNFPSFDIEINRKRIKRRAATFCSSRFSSQFINSRIAYTVNYPHSTSFSEAVECQ